MNSQTSLCGRPYHEARESALPDELDSGMTSVSARHGGLLHVTERRHSDIPILKQAERNNL